MNPFWSQLARGLSPYVPGEQPRITNLVKLNTNESPCGPSPLVLEAMQAAAAAADGRQCAGGAVCSLPIVVPADRV
jgi:histidinol-phosphate/aromatic aminotransferase/cobyric acid decarboxylase-like protein